MVCALVLAAAAIAAPPEREFRAAWVATVANIDWPSKPGLSAAAMRAEMRAILDRAHKLHLNALILQVRPAADAIYPSKLEPWTEFLSGTQGRAPGQGYDPLAEWVAESHARGIELHAWFNPYRASHPIQKSTFSPTHVVKTHPNWVRNYGEYRWMDPGEPKVRERTKEVMLDVVRRYDIDGVHIDDYFYPYRIKDAKNKYVDFPDEATYRAYRAKGGTLAKDDWRRDNVNKLVREVYAAIKKTKPWVRFGISPFGVNVQGAPKGIVAGVDQYKELYADVLTWWKNGWCDYLAPQLYWPVSQQAQSYPVLLDYWRATNAKKRHLWPGSFTSRTNPKDGNWPAQELLDQIALTRDRPDTNGQIHFSMQALMADWNGVATALEKGPYARPALVPAATWLSAKKPPTPLLTKKGDAVVATLRKNSGPAPIRGWLVRGPGGGLIRRLAPIRTTFQPGTYKKRATVSALDAFGNESKRLPLP